MYVTYYNTVNKTFPMFASIICREASSFIAYPIPAMAEMKEPVLWGY